MAKKKVEVKLHPIDAGFERASKEYKAFVKMKLQEYRDQGVEIDVAAHEPHWQKVYLLGKMQIIQEQMTEEKGDNDVKETKSKRKTTGRKKSTTKRKSKPDSRQLSLGV